jgi:hypothetical protein
MRALWCLLLLGVAAAQVREQSEFDLYDSIKREGSAQKRLLLLKQWKEKYADSKYREERELIFIQTYQALEQPKEILATAKLLVGMNPGNIQGLYWAATLVPALEVKDPGGLDLGERAGRGLLEADKPAGSSGEDWAKAKRDLEALGHKVLGYVALTRHQPEQAEREFTRSLELVPQQAQVSSWLGTAIFGQKKERQSEVLYHFARAAVLDPEKEGGLTPPAVRQSVEDYLAKAYAQYHGADAPGLAQLKAEAAKAALPPPGFAIEDIHSRGDRR